MPVAGPRTYWSMPEGINASGVTARLYLGDAEKILGKMPAGSVHCVVTSPPYWPLRKYGDGSRADAEVGREPTLAEYVERLVAVFRQARRVLRDDGSAWINLGDTYQGRKDGGIAGLPWRVAFALEEDGWVLRQDIVWHRTTAMPDGSATTRCVKGHEYVFLLVKNNRFFFDPEAIKNDTGSYRRSVWPIANPGYPGLHYATYPEELVRLCVSAGTSEAGCCPRCRSPLRRVTRREGGRRVESHEVNDRDRSYKWSRNGVSGSLDGEPAKVITVGWGPACGCAAGDPVPCTVLDPFVGSGTTVAVANKLGRRGAGIDLYEQYLRDDAIPRITKANGG